MQLVTPLARDAALRARRCERTAWHARVDILAASRDDDWSSRLARDNPNAKPNKRTPRSQVMHKLDDGANGFAASGAAGGAINEAEARALAKDTVKIAARAARRFSGFTCYAALTNIKASNIEEVSYQILLGSDKYFVSTDGGGDRQQWFALIREDVGGVDPEPTAEEPNPKLARLRREFAATGGGDQNGDVWDPFALELIDATPEADIKRRDLYDGTASDAISCEAMCDVTRHGNALQCDPIQCDAPHCPYEARRCSTPCHGMSCDPIQCDAPHCPREARRCSTRSTRSGSGRRGARAPSRSAATPRTR